MNPTIDREMRNKTIYLAGPEVFLADAIEVGLRKQRLCSIYKFVGLFPLDNVIDAPPGRPLSRAIYRANMRMIAQADLLIANLTPFRGPSADVGTVFELGVMKGLGKPVLGYTNCAGDLLAKTRQFDPAAQLGSQAQVWRDGHGLEIENFGNSDNLMISECLEEAGYPLIVRDVPASLQFHDLEGFEACLSLAQDMLSTIGNEAGSLRSGTVRGAR